MKTRTDRPEVPFDGAPPGIHVVAKPAGPACNLDCAYCFYLEKQALFGTGVKCRMSDAVLNAFIANYVESQPAPEVEFVWQGGEPTLMGLDFFRRVVEIQRRFAKCKSITNSLQTNGTLLTDEWCAFLRKHRFMVGLSLDGPREIHDRYRRDRTGRGTFDAVMRGLELLIKHGVEYNVLACVARETAHRPMEVYRFLRDRGVEFIQFTPVVERPADAAAAAQGLRLAGFASPGASDAPPEVTPWTVLPEAYGDFLIAVYEEWVRRDVGTVFVMNFEWALNAWVGNPSPVCVHARQCGRSLAVEYSGDVYACDHGVYPQLRLGNVKTDRLSDLAERSRRSGFGVGKETTLPLQCRECEVLALCRGACPKHRFTESARGEPGLHYLCTGYRKFFRHIRKYLRAITQLLENGYPADLVMRAVDRPLLLRPTHPPPGEDPS